MSDETFCHAPRAPYQPLQLVSMGVHLDNQPIKTCEDDWRDVHGITFCYMWKKKYKVIKF